jgi:hypothetical protein
MMFESWSKEFSLPTPLRDKTINSIHQQGGQVDQREGIKIPLFNYLENHTTYRLGIKCLVNYTWDACRNAHRSSYKLFRYFCSILTKTAMCSLIFSKIPKYKISWKSVQWFLSSYTQADTTKLTHIFVAFHSWMCWKN